MRTETISELNAALSNNVLSKLEKIKVVAENFQENENKLSMYQTSGYVFLFWALMILTVDERQKEKLPLICDFARMMNITDEEILDLVTVAKTVYQTGNKGELTTYNVRTLFAKVLTMYDYS